MFVGHYGISFAIKSREPTLPLWLLFIAVQFIDVLWAFFILAGIEKVRIVPGITATNPLDLHYMPYTHSLVSALAWSVAVMAACKLVPRFRKSVGAASLAGAAVFSHWLLDLLVHRPDLPLYDDTFKVGLGLWNFPLVAFLLEAALLFGGLYLYYASTTPVSRGGTAGMIIFALIMLAAQLAVFFGPPPASATALAVTALISYFGFAVVIFWLERKRA